MANDKVTMHLDGMEALQKAITQAPELVRVRASEVVARSTFSVGQRARALTRVNSGATKAAIEAITRGLNGRVGIASGDFRGRRPESYWFFQHYGTEHMEANPFFRTATEAETETFIRDTRKIGTDLERAWSSGRFV